MPTSIHCEFEEEERVKTQDLVQHPIKISRPSLHQSKLLFFFFCSATYKKHRHCLLLGRPFLGPLLITENIFFYVAIFCLLTSKDPVPHLSWSRDKARDEIIFNKVAPRRRVPTSTSPIYNLDAFLERRDVKHQIR